MAYDPAFRGGVNIAVADVTGDGYADVVTGAGPGGGPHVKVFDTATGQAVYSFFAYEDSFRGGVSVAAGFVSGSNGRADVVTAPGPGGGPLVRDFNGVSGRLAREWLAYDAGFRGGMSVAVGELTGDGQADIVTGAGAGGGPHVKVFDGATVSYGLFSDLPVLTVRQFSAYDPAFRGGVRVAAAELTGDAYAEILTAPGPGGGPYVKVFDGQTGGMVRQWLTGDAAFRGGLAVAGLAPVVPGEAVTRSFDFREGAQGWEHGFADVDATTASQYQSESRLLPLPAELGEGTGYMLQGANVSDDLFMFLRRQLGPADGVRPVQAYRVRFDVQFGSNAPSDAAGVGGPPGEGVVLKAGAGAEEPRAVEVDEGVDGRHHYLRMSVDKSRLGSYASILGDISNGLPPGPDVPYVAVKRIGTHAFPAKSDASGNLWLLVGTDSSFEGFTRLYYLRITVTLLPLQGIA